MIEMKFKGMPKIDVAKTVKDIAVLKNAYAKAIMDRSETLKKELVGAVIAQGIMSYEGRNPRPALDKDGNFRRTDLDLLSFLAPIAARGAIIEIPRYSNRRQIVRRASERKIGTNRFGRIVGLVSNQESLSFSVRIKDQSVVWQDPLTGEEELGGFRSFMIIDCDGRRRKDWNEIVWDPSAKENAFLESKGLWTGNTVFFRYYVHPNRWQSVFGAPYMLKKMLLERIDDEADFYRREMKRLMLAGIELPTGEKKTKERGFVGLAKKIRVKTIEMKLALPDFSGNYEPVPLTKAGLVQAYRRQKLLTYVWKPAVQFTARADEVAYMRFGLDAGNNGKIAHWIKNTEWNLRETSASSPCYQLELGGMSLLYRVKTITEKVSSV